MIESEQDNSSPIQFMGWLLNTIKGFVDPRAAGESIIQSMERLFQKHQEMYPGMDPHWHLALTWQSRMATHGVKNDEVAQAKALAKVLPFAHLPFPKNIRGLGIATIIFERQDIMRQCPEFDSEFDDLLAPVAQADEQGTREALYARYNPKFAAEARKS